MNRLPLIPFLLAAALAGAPALAQPAPSLPENLPAAAELNENQVRDIQAFVAARAKGLTAGEAADVSRARKELVQPLENRAVTVRFRLAYAQALGDALRAAANSPNEQQVINALRLSGELATPSAMTLISPALTDKRPAVRYAAAFAAARLFEAVEQHEPAPAAGQLVKLVRDLRLPLEAESDPIVIDGLVLALSAATRIPDQKFRDQNPPVRAVAVETLARAGTVKAQGLAQAPAPCPTLASLQRGLRTMRDVLANVAQAQLPGPTLNEVKTFTNDLIKAAAGVNAAGTACDAEQVKQATAAAEAVRKLAGG